MKRMKWNEGPGNGKTWRKILLSSKCPAQKKLTQFVWKSPARALTIFWEVIQSSLYYSIVRGFTDFLYLESWISLFIETTRNSVQVSCLVPDDVSVSQSDQSEPNYGRLLSDQRNHSSHFAHFVTSASRDFFVAKTARCSSASFFTSSLFSLSNISPPSSM